MVCVVLGIVAVAVSPPSALAERPYEWKLTCDGTSSSATWFWTLDGSEILGTRMTATCGPDTSGTGTRPADANGFTVTMTFGPGTLTESATFEPTHHFNLRTGVKVNTWFTIPGCPDPELHHQKCKVHVAYSTTFTVHSWPS